MKVKELKHIIDTQLADMPSYADWEVVIPIKGTYNVGAIGTVKTTGAVFGFDWEHGLFMIDPECGLTPYKDFIKKNKS